MASSVARVSVGAPRASGRAPAAPRRPQPAPTLTLTLSLRPHRRAAVAVRAEAEEAEAEVQVADDWTNRYVEGEDIYASETAAPEYRLRFLWLPKNIAVGVDQVFSSGNSSPLTEFYFWPRKDAWEELKASLEAKSWISERDTVLMLNKTTEVINYWQEDEVKHSLEEAQQMFPDCEFLGA